ncbi:MAG: PAS domain-containing protein [Bdellovibrionales bacterium]
MSTAGFSCGLSQSLPDGTFDYVSPQWIQCTGLAEDLLLGFGWLNRAIHPDDRERTLLHWAGAVESRHPYDIEFRIRRVDGEYRWFKTRGTPVRDSKGQVDYYNRQWYEYTEVIHMDVLHSVSD